MHLSPAMKRLGFSLLALALAGGMAIAGDPGSDDLQEGQRNSAEQGPEKGEGHALLGVATASLPDSLREHLGVEEGFGIQVHEVIEDSPAARAGLKRHDVLLSLDDQLLISPRHLSLLVGLREPGDLVRVERVQRGQRETLEIALAEMAEVTFPGASPDSRALPPSSRVDPAETWRKRLREQQDLWQQWMEGGDRGADARPPDSRGGESRPDRPVPGFPITVLGQDGVVKIDNAQGEVTLHREADDCTIRIRDRDGRLLHEGPYDREAGIEGLPDKAREQLERMEIDELGILFPPSPPKKPEKTMGTPPRDDRLSHALPRWL